MSTKYTGNQLKHLGKAGIKSALKNRGLRSKLPDSYLPPKLLARRHHQASAAKAKAAHAAAGSREVVPGSGLTQKSYDRQVAAATKIKYGEQERELGRQLGVNQAQQTRDAGWYDQYRQQIQGAEQRQAATNQALVGQLAQLSQAGLEASGGAKMQQGQVMHDDAASRGVASDPGLQPLADHAALIRSALTNNFGATTALQNNAALNNLGGVEMGAGLAKLEHLGGLSSAGNQILKDQGNLAADKGTYRQQVGQDLKDAARKQVLENQVFGVKQQTAAVSAADKAHDNNLADANYRTNRHDKAVRAKEARRRDRRAEAKDARAVEKDTYQREHHLGPYKPAAVRSGSKLKHGKAPASDATTPAGVKVRTPAQHDKISGSIDSTRAVVSSLKAKYHNNRHRVAGAILSDPKNKGELATSIALDLAFDGHVSAHNRQILWQRGYSLSELGLPGPTNKRKRHR